MNTLNKIFNITKSPFNGKYNKNPYEYEKEKLYKDLKPFDVNSDKLETIPFKSDQYIPKKTKKKQVVLHHTVSDPFNSKGDINYWLSTSQRIATQLVIRGDGKALQCFSSKFWGYHLGAGNANLDKHSIGIEIDNWGGLTKKSDGFYNAYGNKLEIPDNEIIYFENGFRGYKYFQKYTEAQIDTVGELLLLFNKKYNIPLKYKEEMWDVSKNALSGKPGIWAHVSYRKDKNDVFPQPELINMLKSLK